MANVFHAFSGRHAAQITKRDMGLAKRMTEVWSLDYLPGDFTNSFLGKRFIRAGAAVALSQMSQIIRDEYDQVRQMICVLGIRAAYEHGVRTITRSLFARDLGLRPHGNATGRVLNPVKDPDVTRRAFEADVLRQKASNYTWKLPIIPRVPTDYRAFRETALPPVCDTPDLRRRVAAHLKQPTAHVHALDEGTRNMLLAAEWQTAFIAPGQEGNNTGYYLLPEELCSDTAADMWQPVAHYEGFGRLIGVSVWNPAKELRGPKVPNPAIKVAATLNLDLAYWEEFTHQQVDALTRGMREAIGPDEVMFTLDDLCNGVQYPAHELQSSSLDLLTDMGEAWVVKHLRSRMAAHIAEGCTDTDLLNAAAEPNRPLWASGMFKTQLLAVQDLPRETVFRFGPAELGCVRVLADFGAGDRYRWYTRAQLVQQVLQVVQEGGE